MNKVDAVLASSEKTRNNDLELILSVWEREGLYLTDQQRQTILDRCTTPESITRRRRALQQNNKYLANENVQRYREEKAREAQESLGQSVSQVPQAITWLDDGERI